MDKIPHSSTLFDFVTKTSPLANTDLLRHLFREILRLNLTLQFYGIWHRDCKPENILYCKTDRSLHLIDFGSAAPVQNDDFREFQVGRLTRSISRHCACSRSCSGHIGDHGTRMDPSKAIQRRKSVCMDIGRLPLFSSLSRISVSFESRYCQWPFAFAASIVDGQRRLSNSTAMFARQRISPSTSSSTSVSIVVELNIDITHMNRIAYFL
jgi:serine/threonine protein kinase